MNAMITKKSSCLSLAVLCGALALAAALPARADARVNVGVSVGFRLPHGAVEVHVGRDRYYTHRGVYYRQGPHGYYVVRAPRGVVVRELPPRYVRIHAGGRVYYRYGDVYYERAPGGYVVVDAPTTVVRELPPPTADDGYQSVWVGEKEYKFHDGQFFKPTADGLVWVEAPLGAITRNLPADARSVWHQEIEYFESDDVYFRKTPEGYKVVEAPWKK
jgi:hypothetical protein